MMKQQLVWQDMSEAPKDRQIIVGIKSEEGGAIRFEGVVFIQDVYEQYEEDGDSDPGMPSSKNTWFSENEVYYYSNDELVGWIEVPWLISHS